MATGKITKTAIDSLVASGQADFLWDTELKGFGVKITPLGKRSYVYQFRMGGRGTSTKRVTIGDHGSPWTVTTARKEAERLALLAAHGTDPIAAAADAKRIAVDLAFKTYAERFAKSCEGEGWRLLVERTLRLHVSPHWKGKSLPDVKKGDVTTLLDRIPNEQIALRRNTFAVIRRLFSWAVGRGDIEHSPIDGMESPPAVAARDRVLDDFELAVIWAAAASAGPLFGPIVKLLMATGQRREEVTRLDWSELDQTAALWRLPRDRAKNGVAHVIPLNQLAIELLDDLARVDIWPKEGAVFKTAGRHPFTAHARGKARLDKEATVVAGRALRPWRLHDLRRTMATNFQRLGVRFEVTEAALNHVGSSRTGVAAVYQRHDWLPEKQAAFALWGDHLRAIIMGSDTVAGG